MPKIDAQHIVSFLLVSIGTMMTMTFGFVPIINLLEAYSDKVYALLFWTPFGLAALIFGHFSDKIKDIFYVIFESIHEEGNTITYRKHWFVLLRRIWLPTLLLLALAGLLVSRLVQLAASPGLSLIQNLSDGSRIVDTTALTLPILMIPVLGWWIYQYLDWSNDIFRVSSDQILDIDRKPFGTEQRRAAPLDNILSTEYKREGFAGYIFNFGTVYITVGGAQLTFDNVLDPAGVQSDIDTRRMARIASKKKDQMKSERERMAEWIASYHQNVEDIRSEQELKDTKPKKE